MINPMVVEGQIIGGVVQGLGGVLYEHMVYDADGNPPHDELHGLPAADGRRSAPLRDRPRGDAFDDPPVATREWGRAARSGHRRRS